MMATKVLVVDDGVQFGELISALEERGVVMHYQPQVELDSFQVVGVESLVRLLDADGNVCYPGRFVHLAELEGLNKHLTALDLVA
ncbi:EAL domain-containing protein [Hydrogenovibrio marinus]|nr:EAL domain-containing protein [Hydrogenovibrio marinus]